MPFVEKEKNQTPSHSYVQEMIYLVFTTIYTVSSDCPNMIQFAYNLGIQSKQPAIWMQLLNDCCSASGVTCDGSQRVTHISWTSKELNGYINGTAIPSSVLLVLLYRNELTGTIPSHLPLGLTTLQVDGNKMSGDLPSFPSALHQLALGYPGSPGNQFTGTLKLNRPRYLYINDNYITDVIIQDNSVLGTGGYICDLSDNPLSGNPKIANLPPVRRIDYSVHVLCRIPWDQ